MNRSLGIFRSVLAATTVLIASGVLRSSTAAERPVAVSEFVQRVRINVAEEDVGVLNAKPAFFPKSGVERATRLVAGDGGYLDLARAKDGRQLWFRRGWDDGGIDTVHFELRPSTVPLPPGLVLQFVDGVLVKRRGPSEDVASHVVKRNGGYWELLREVWLVDVNSGRAYRPGTTDSYPLVRAKGKYDARRASVLQWMVFSEHCADGGGPCVLFGSPKDVARRISGEDTDGVELWIFPA